MTIASKFRLKGGANVERVKRLGKVLQSKNFGVVYLKNQEKSFSRFAFVVSTKISKLAVHRNRVDRAMTEAVRMDMPKIPVGYDYVFLAKKTVANKTTEEIMREVTDFIPTLKEVIK